MLEFSDYLRLVEKISVGKRLPSATYIHVDGIGRLPAELLAFLGEIQGQIELDGSSFNVIKFHKTDFKISLLDYPDFMADPHPALSSSTVIDVESMSATRRSYSGSDNRPILHRKETFLPEDHERFEGFRALTREEERLGLYRNRAQIGFEKQWSVLLAERGIRYEGHEVVIENSPHRREGTDPELSPSKDVSRSKTALSRFGLSRPVQKLLKHGLLSVGRSFFDYGCGLGDDVRGLRKMGIDATGWDPVLMPEAEKTHADVVNLGFVINVVEDSSERIEILKEAFSLAKHLLVTAVQIGRGDDGSNGRPYRDGVLTARGTFQKYFTHDEFRSFLEGHLGVDVVSVGPGIFFVFKNPIDAQDFLAHRSTRSVDFDQLRESLFGSKPRRTSPSHPARHRQSFYEQHQEVLDRYWTAMLSIGRPPGPEEYEHFREIESLGLTGQRAKNLYLKLFGRDALDEGFLETNRPLIEAFWNKLEEYGRIPRMEEFDQFVELEGLGVFPEQLRNLYVRSHGRDHLSRAFRKRHERLISDFWKATIRLGRPPRLAEFDGQPEFLRLGLTSRQAHAWFLEEYGEEVYQEAVDRRRDDLIVYSALANFRRKVPLKHLPERLQNDFKTFFGSYQKALELGRKKLFSLGGPGKVAELCEKVRLGWQNRDSLLFHPSLVEDLPAELRILLGCAEILAGDLSQSDVIKIHKNGRKVTLMTCEGFESLLFPQVKTRIKVNLTTQSVTYFDHSSDEDPWVLCGKHRLLGSNHPTREEWSVTFADVRVAIGEINLLLIPRSELHRYLERAEAAWKSRW